LSVSQLFETCVGLFLFLRSCDEKCCFFYNYVIAEFIKACHHHYFLFLKRACMLVLTLIGSEQGFARVEEAHAHDHD